MLSVQSSDGGLDGRSTFSRVGDAEPELVGDHSFLPHPTPKLEGDDVWMLLLGCNLEDGVQMVPVFDSGPACPVRQLP